MTTPASQKTMEVLHADDITPLHGSQILAAHEHYGSLAAGVLLGGGTVAAAELGWNSLIAGHPFAHEFISQAAINHTGTAIHTALTSSLGTAVVQGGLTLALGTAIDRSIDFQIKKLHDKENQTVLKVEKFLNEHQKTKAIAGITKVAASYYAGFKASGLLVDVLTNLSAGLSKAAAVKLSFGALAFIPNPVLWAVVAAAGTALIATEVVKHRKRNKAKSVV